MLAVFVALWIILLVRLRPDGTSITKENRRLGALHQPPLFTAARLRAEREPIRRLAPTLWIRMIWSACVPAAPEEAKATLRATSSPGSAIPPVADFFLFPIPTPSD